MILLEIEKIKENPENPRTITDSNFEKLKRSIKDFPEMINLRPLVVNDDLVVLGGNQRLKALKELGYKKVPVLKASSLTEAQQKEFIIKDNLPYGEWDWNLLGESFDLDLIEDWGLDLPDDMQSDIPIQAVEDDFEAEPIEQIKTDIKSGDIIQIGPHRLMCGDSTETADVERLMDGAKADLWLTDPPYNVDYTGKTEDALKVANDSMSDDDFRKFLKKAFNQAFSSMKAGASFYIFHAPSEGYNFLGAVKDCLEEVRQCLIWLKQTLVMGRQDYQWKHEPCLYGWKKGASHFWNSDRKQTTILEFDRPSRSSEHPTMKPVSMFSHLINNSSKQSALVLDTFLGSGTTMVACHQLKRICYGMELEPKYCQVIVDRMKKLDPGIKIVKV